MDKKTRKNQKYEQEVEHIFGFPETSSGQVIEQSMNEIKIKSIGIARATGIIGL